MADKKIGELSAAAELYDDSMLVAEQQGKAVKVSGRLFKQFAQVSVEQYVEAAQEAPATRWTPWGRSELRRQMPPPAQTGRTPQDTRLKT